ncbi:uncharacterized protein ACA1_139700 [Acanthamoeba castellanii str. Neff]|uniref:Uncharacterized protein n=1 Tax=Acanthamoeba castellanii (strain ATCC 30010 / Neff) TaxID=1257118 RepID=L8GNA9_ACACF|nr:uncharacterized protein ACA1_139700 [Acanthamoeba castellanii str. Neff]ELR14233.1 hypothetical protein ACA1_139700 [Acanthamoeba castellanii str. Neff]
MVKGRHLLARTGWYVCRGGNLVRREVELVLELLIADGREEGVVREVRLPVVPREVTDAPTVAASGEEEEEEELQKEAAAAPSGRHRRWWGCCQAATHTIALHAPPAHADDQEEAVGLVLLLAFADDRAASHFMDYVFYLQTVAPPVPANEDGEPGDEEEEEEEEEAAEREDYDEKYTFTQTEYWECFHEETGQECFEWYSAEELQRHSFLRVLGRFFVPALAAASAASAATPVYRGCLDCFVNGTGRALVPTYFQRVLRPDGHFLMITVSNIDLPLILQTGGEVAQKAVFRKNLVEPHLGPDEIIAARQLHRRAPGTDQRNHPRLAPSPTASSLHPIPLSSPLLFDTTNDAHPSCPSRCFKPRFYRF